jgi:hypothetical protein
MCSYGIPDANRAAVAVAYDSFPSRRNRWFPPSFVRGETQPHRRSDAPDKLGKLIGLTRFLGAALIVAAFAASAQAQTSVTLAWDPDPSGAIAGYHLHERIDGQPYTNVIDVGNATSATVSNLIAGVTYFFAVSAYDMNQVESDPSGEIPYTVPLPTNNVPTIGLQICASAGGPVILIGTGQPGQTYNVQASQDLKLWIAIGTVTTDASGSFTFSDPAGTSRPVCMYRLQLVEVTPPKLQICASAGEPLNLIGTGQPGQRCNVLSSQDFVTWALIGTMTLDASGSAQFTETAGTTSPVCLYRLQCIEAPKLQTCPSVGGSVLLIGTGQPGQTYNVLSSQDFVTWTPIGTMTLDATGSGYFTVPAGTGVLNRVYQLQAQ